VVVENKSIGILIFTTYGVHLYSTPFAQPHMI
jgi:hypothetical protein